MKRVKRPVPPGTRNLGTRENMKKGRENERKREKERKRERRGIK